MKKVLFVFALSMILFLSGCLRPPRPVFYEFEFRCAEVIDGSTYGYKISGQGIIEVENEGDAYIEAFGALFEKEEKTGDKCVMKFIRPMNGSFSSPSLPGSE